VLLTRRQHEALSVPELLAGTLHGAVRYLEVVARIVHADLLGSLELFEVRPVPPALFVRVDGVPEPSSELRL